jgi:hypothetical protein
VVPTSTDRRRREAAIAGGRWGAICVAATTDREIKENFFVARDIFSEGQFSAAKKLRLMELVHELGAPMKYEPLGAKGGAQGGRSLSVLPIARAVTQSIH